MKTIPSAPASDPKPREYTSAMPDAERWRIHAEIDLLILHARKFDVLLRDQIADLPVSRFACDYKKIDSNWR